MKQEINLEELLNEISNINLDEDGNRIYYLWEVKKFVKVLCGKLLDIAAENAYVEYIDLETNEIFDYTDVITDNGVGANISKQSILQIKDLIK